MFHSDKDLSYSVLKSLICCGYHLTEKEKDDADAIIEMIKSEIADAVWMLGAMQDIRDTGIRLNLISSFIVMHI